MKNLIVEWAENRGRLFAQELDTTPDRDNWGKLNENDDMPEGDYKAIVRTFPNSTSDEIERAVQAYRRGFNNAISTPVED